MVQTLKTSSNAPLLQIDSQTDTLLRLLSQIILVDGHVHSSEMDALICGVRRLSLQDSFGRDLSDADILGWFEDYKRSVDAGTSSVPQNVALIHIIMNLADWPDKQGVIDALTEISVSDANFHIEEKSLISIVQAYWQFEGLEVSNTRIEV